MPRAKGYGFIACVFGLIAGAYFFNYSFYSINLDDIDNFNRICSETYFSIAIPIGLVTLAVLGSGFWIGWTILTIKVVSPMPDIVEKKDFAKVKAFFLCLATLLIAAVFIYGIYIRSYWALAVPAAVITLVVLGMIFWVGIAIITTRKTLPESSE